MIKKVALITDVLECTNEPYAIVKIAGIKMCESYNLQYGTNFISVMRTNLYGPNDNFDLEKSHILPALIRKMQLGKALENNNWDTIRKDLNKLPIERVDGKNEEEEILNILSKYGIQKSLPDDQEVQIPALPAGGSNPCLAGRQVKSEISLVTPSGGYLQSQVSVEIWGSGKPMREFLLPEDMADACVFLMENRDFKDTYDQDQMEIRNTHIKLGTGKDISIKALAELIKKEVGFKGDLIFNVDKPDGTMKKLTDV